MTQIVLLEKIACKIVALDLMLKQVEEAIASSQPFGKITSSVARILIDQRELIELTELGSQLGDTLGQGVTVDRIRQRLNELDIRWQSCRASLGNAQVESMVRNTLRRYIDDYCERIRIQVEELQQSEVDQYTIDFLDEVLYNYETLTIRDSIAQLLCELVDSEDLKDALVQLTVTDRLFKTVGRYLYKPVIENGRLQDLRTVNFIPPSHWWYYPETQ